MVIFEATATGVSFAILGSASDTVRWGGTVDLKGVQKEDVDVEYKK